MNAEEKLVKRLQAKGRKHELVEKKIQALEIRRKGLETEIKDLKDKLNFAQARKIKEVLAKEGLEGVKVNDLAVLLAENKERLLNSGYE